MQEEEKAFTYQTAKGTVTVVGEGEFITEIHFGKVCAKQKNIESTPTLEEAGRQLQEYFLGKRKVFALPLKMKGTEFQKQVWNALLTIPYGETRSYSEIAQQIGNPKAVRAVGMANHRNPIAIVVPCHRVIGKNGTLTGYAGGLDKKEMLLKLERENHHRKEE